MKKTLSFLAIAAMLLALTSCGEGKATLSGTIRETVSLQIIEDALVTANGKTARTNNEGMFAIPGLTPGKVDVEITKEGYRTITFPEFVIVEGDKNFIEATMDIKTEAKNIPSKEFGKPQPNPPPLPGTPVANRPTLKVVENFDGFTILMAYGDQKATKNSQVILASKGMYKILPQNQVQSDIGAVIFAKDATYNFDGKNWIGVKTPEGAAMPDPLTDLKVYYKTILDCYKNKVSQLNSLGSMKYLGIDCTRFRLVGFTTENANKVDGEVYVPKTGQYKDTILYFQGIIEVNGPGDMMTLQLQPGTAKTIEIPKNAIMQGPGQPPPNPGGR